MNSQDTFLDVMAGLTSSVLLARSGTHWQMPRGWERFYPLNVHAS